MIKFLGSENADENVQLKNEKFFKNDKLKALGYIYPEEVKHAVLWLKNDKATK